MRKRYDWIFIIEDNGLTFEFYRYKKEHKKVRSINRLARSFVVGHHLKYHYPCYEVGQTEMKEVYFERLVQLSWL